MDLAKQHLVDALITYWTEGPSAVDEESRRRCREVIAVLARSMSGLELLALQESPEKRRSEIEARVGVWLAMTAGRQDAALAAPVTRDLGSHLRPPAPESASPKPEPAASVPVATREGEPSVRIRQSNQGGVNLGTVGTVNGGLNLAMPASPVGGAREGQETSARAEESRAAILFLGANPSDSSPLRLDEEARAIDRALATATFGNRCDLVQKWAVRVGELQEHLLRTKPRVLHFSGHGSRDRTIMLQGEDGLSRPVAADRLARLLARFSQRLRCVVLNSCYSREHGEAIAEHIDCVVGMSAAVPDIAAIRFSAAFYQAAASGCSIQDAFEQARADIELGEFGGEELPVLLSRRDPSQIHLLRKEA